jgi:flagellar basal-body rod protein FlgG
MIRALYTSASAMLFGMRQQEMTAGNLANSGTSGYKAETSAASAFSGVLARRVGASEMGAPAPVRVGEVLGTVGTGVYQSVRGNDFDDGALRNTDLKLDFALTGPGFFVVDTPDGPAYTRDGHFLRNQENTLVTDAGEPVLGIDGGPITVTGDNIRLTPQGELMVNDQPAGTLQVVQFDVSRAVRAGSTRFIVGEGDEATPITPGEGTTITQGALEEANVNAAASAAQVISVARAFEASQHIFTSISETLRETVNEVGRVARQ